MKLHLPNFLRKVLLACMLTSPILGYSATLTWNNAAGTNVWSTTDANWNDGSSNVAFTDNSGVTFTENNAGNVTINGTLTPSGITFTGGTYTFSGTGSIAGTGGMTIQGGNVTINNANTFSGASSITAGTLNINAANAIGTSNLTINGGTVNISTITNVTHNNLILSSGTVTVGSADSTVATGTSNLNLTGNAGSTLNLYLIGNTTETGGGDSTYSLITGISAYQGTVRILSGLLNVSQDDGAQDSIAGVEKVVLNNAGLLFKNQATTFSKNIEVEADSTGIIRPYGSGNVTLSGTITGEGNLFKTDGGQVTYTGAVNIGGNYTSYNGSTTFAGTTNIGGVTSLRASNLIIRSDVTTGRLVGCDTSAATTITIESSGSLTITGSTTSNDPATAAFMLAHWPQTGTVNISGALNVLNAGLSFKDGNGVINVLQGGEFNIGSLTLSKNTNCPITVTNGRINVGATGISGYNTGLTLSLSNSTLGMLSSTWEYGTLNISLVEGANTFDTQVQSINTTTNRGQDTDQAGNMSITGIISGNGSIIKAGDGTLTLGGVNTFTGGVDIQKGTVTVGTETGLGTGTTTMASTTAILNLNNQAVSNKIELSNGTIQNSGAYTGELVINQSGSGVTVGQLSMGGLSGCTMNITSGVSGDTVTTLTGIAGNVTLTGSNTIALNSNMYSGAGSQTSAIDATGGTITLGTGSTLDLKLTDALAELLLNDTTSSTIDLNVTSGTLSGQLSQISLSSSYAAFKYIYTVTGTSGGKVVLTQHANNTLIVPSGDSLDISSGDQLGVANKAHIFNNGTINVTAPAGTNVTLNGFEGGTSGILNTGSNTNTTITLAQGGLSDSDTAVYNGKIDGSAGIDKTGAFTQKLGGTVNASSVTVSQGKLVFTSPSGNSTISGNINVANGATLGVSGSGTTLTGQSLTSNAGSTIDLGSGSTLNISGTGATTLNGNVTGSGTLEVNGALSVGTGGFTPSGSDTYNTTTVKLNNTGSLNLDKNVQVGALAGNGTVNLADNTLTLGGANGVFDGTINGTNGSTIAMDGSTSATQVLNGAGNANTGLNVSKGTLVLQNKEGASATYGAANVASGATLQIGGYPGGSSTLQPHSTNVHLSSLTMASGSTLNLYYGNNASGDLIPPALTTTTAANIGSGVKIKVSSYISENDIALKGGSDVSLTLIHGESGTASIAADSANPLMGFLTAMYEWKLKAEGSDIVLDGTTRQGNYYDQAGLTHNSSAVANLLYNASNAIASAPGSTLRDLADYVADSINLGNIEDAAHAMSAASGSSITGLIMAQNNQMYDQMESIRNRTVTMGANPSMDNSDAPYYHFWVQGNGGYNDLNTSRDESGYKLTTWGGTVGMDVDFNDRWSGGVAFSATFGDLKAHAADSASGDMDSYYLSLFARYQRKAWAHTLILTGGWNDMKLNRSVNYGGGSYMGHGKTHGGGFGAMYELTYDIKLNEDSTSIFQPLFNIAVSDTSVKGYDETGAGNAGLRVNKMDMTTTTLGLGGRWIGLFGSNLFGRESVGQFRANVSQELGDNRGKANVAFLGNPGYSQQVIGAKAGTTALQLGASITTPLNQNSSVFLEANADFRTKQNSVGGSIGYRYDF